MSIHFASMTVSQITDRAHKLMEEGTALARLAGALAEFEESTGRKLFVSEADQGTSYVGMPGPAATTMRPDPALTAPKAVAEVTTPAPAPAPIKKSNPAKAARSLAPQARDAKPVKKPAPMTASAPAAAPAAPAPQITDRPWGALKLAERAIVKHLERLPATFTPLEDLTLAELLIGGNRVEGVALQLEVSADQALTRWKGFLCSDVLGANGKPSIDGQQRLLTALRYRVETAA